MTIEQRKVLATQMRSLLKKAADLDSEWQGKEMPSEIANQISELLGQSDTLKVRIDNLDRQQKGNEFLDSSDGTAALHHGWRSSAKEEGNVAHDPKAWRELDVKIQRPYGIVDTVKVRYNVPIVTQGDLYKDAFMEYLQKGRSMVRPQGQKTLLEGTDSSGGFFVPEDFQMQLIRKVATTAVFRQYGRIVTTSRDSIKWPKITYTADNNYTSGVRLTWTGESPASASVHRATDPVSGLIDIPVNTAMASLLLSMQLLEDSAFDVEGISTELLGEAFALGEEVSFWTGSGAGQPLGIVTNIDATDGVASVNSGSASTLTDDGLIDLIYDLPAQYENGARIFWRKATEKVVRKLKNSTTDEYVWPAEERVGSFGQVDRTILGHPITRAEFVPAIAGNAFPIIFGQLSGYFIVDRVGLSFQRLDELYAEQGLVGILARKRVGGQVVEPWRLRAQKIST